MLGRASLAAQETAQELVILSSRKEPLVRPVIDLFEKETGIRVILKTGESAILGQQILQESPAAAADIYIAKESGSLEYLRSKGAFEPIASTEIFVIPQEFRSREGYWVGVSGRARAVIYNEDLISYEDVPKTLWELADPRFKGMIAAAHSGNESLVAWVSALRLSWGDEETERFLTALKENEIALISDSHTDVRKAVGRGEYALGLINHYYYHLQKHEPDPETTHVGIVYLDQEEGERGELVNVTGAAIIQGAPHREQAKRFVEFLLSPEAQKLFAEVNFEYPLRAGVETHPEVLEAMGCGGPSALDCLKRMKVPLDGLGAVLEGTQNLLDRVGWH
ncbi:MAG: extracellular solute-binding protein [Candidatus Omnitrophica bacterium]|nr:extracellular solute-binding protein [Candidatus Omnitrophota bacterium]